MEDHMIILCKKCKVEKDSKYKYYCRSCYQSEWIKNIPDKICIECSKIFKLSGEICHSCLNWKRRQAHRQKACSQCNRKGLVHVLINPPLCSFCDRKNREKADPSLIEKRRKMIRDSGRRKKGTDLNAAVRRSNGTWKTKSGYVMTYKKGHPNSNSNDCILQHVLVMSDHLGRPLKDKENVHHKNGIRDDNRIENLELWHKGQCSGQRLEEKLQWAKDLLEEYGYKVDN
jgi:HNH endonuclease